MSLDWMAQAKCREADTAVFFPQRRGNETVLAVRYARAVCSCCPVIRECLVYVFSFPRGTRPVGIWGGLTVQERSHLPKRCANCSKHLTPEELAANHLGGVDRRDWKCSSCRRPAALRQLSREENEVLAAHAREAALRAKRNWKPGWAS